MQNRLQENNIAASLTWSLDEAANTGLLDILPVGAGKRNAIEFLMKKNGFHLDNTVFSGDSGNDLPVLISPIPSTLVRNASVEVKQEVQRHARNLGTADSLYLARGGFKGMNGNYAAGIVEGSVLTITLEILTSYGISNKCTNRYPTPCSTKYSPI